MEFYSSITDYYDFIFPFTQAPLDYVCSSLEGADEGGPAERPPAVLDIGCATGSLAIGMAKKGFSVTAADFDESMIAAARIKAARELDSSSDIRFRQLDMREIGDMYRDRGFDALICFGNTLVHLTEPSEIADFLSQAAAVLRPKGIFLLQIINYDRILDRNIDGLAAIDNDHVRFERSYEYKTDCGLMAFYTCLTDKKTEHQLRNSIHLYPLRKAVLDRMLRDAGFSEPEYFGAFTGEPFTDKSIPLILRTVKI